MLNFRNINFIKLKKNSIWKKHGQSFLRNLYLPSVSPKSKKIACAIFLDTYCHMWLKAWNLVKSLLFLHLAYFCFLLYLPCINSHLTYHLIIFGQDLTQMSLAFNLFKKINFIFYLYGCFATCVSMHHMHACCLQRPEVGVRSLGNRITDNLSTTWMLGLKCQLSGKAANALKHWPISSVPWLSPCLFLSVLGWN